MHMFRFIRVFRHTFLDRKESQEDLEVERRIDVNSESPNGLLAFII
jgi:hypothetical protein